ncbi:MAG TPA: fibrobacter succinogenes major paralogous domain-containing protein [Ignavibacteria bacterium]
MQQKIVILFAVTLFCTGLTGLQAQTVKDIDGNIYKTVAIGKQIWMAENLKTTKYNDGRVVPLVTDDKAWKALTTPAYCWYNNDAKNNKDKYGALYNWYTVKTNKLCPTGWHVPTDAEWTALTTYLGGESVAGVKLKETGITHWEKPNTGATNGSGFTALPSGYRSGYGSFDQIGNCCYWWSYTEGDKVLAYNRGIGYNKRRVVRYKDYKVDGFSIRCLLD